MKTAMQEWFDELKANYPYMANEIYQKGFEKYLEKEKEMIENAFESGYTDAMLDPEIFGSGKGYIKKTYNQNK